MAFQSIKKLLPPSCPCMEEGLLSDLQSRLTRDPPSLSRDYASFVRQEIGRLYPKGWDSNYSEAVETASPNLSSCLEGGGRSGGSQGYWAARTSIEEFRGLCISGEFPDHFPITDAEAIVVQSAGKPRPLTKFSAHAVVLEPLHRTIYNRLSSFRWLQRGDVSAESLSKAGFSSGWGVLTSGDYKSATDNLPIEVAEIILDEMRLRSCHVPAGVWNYARRILRPHVEWKGGQFIPSVGQMMGSYLSFPLLCLQNYLAFNFTKLQMGYKEKTPVLINGDDILFQSSRDLSRYWMANVGKFGLTVEETKTSTSESFGTLNSTLCRWHGSSLVPVPTVRMGLLKKSEFPHHLGDNLRSFLRGVNKRYWFTATCSFLSWKATEVDPYAVSLAGLGIRGRMAIRALRALGWWEREKDAVALGCVDIPKEPSPHNIVLSSEDIVIVKSEDAWKYSQLQGKAMAEKKWSMSADFKPSREKKVFLKSIRLRYFSKLEALPPYARIALTSDGDHEREQDARALFLRERPISDGKVILRSVFESIEDKCDLIWSHFEAPPAYCRDLRDDLRALEVDIVWPVEGPRCNPLLGAKKGT